MAMQLSADTMLYLDGPGQYAADFGGISVLVDLGRREFTLFVSYLDATDQDYADAQAVMSRFGITHGYDEYWDDESRTVVVLVACF